MVIHPFFFSLEKFWLHTFFQTGLPVATCWLRRLLVPGYDLIHTVVYNEYLVFIVYNYINGPSLGYIYIYIKETQLNLNIFINKD